MKKLFKTLIVYAIYGLIVGELIIRALSITADIPARTIGKDQIQKYLPNQTGYFAKDKHKWQINERGWPGPLPENFDNLITIIGDSFIENFMNPDECHQSQYLKKQFPKLNFFEASRSGVSFIEGLEISKHLDSLNPKYQILYIGDYDLEESISKISIKTDITQLDVEKKELLYGKLKAPILKKILYNWKFAYYFYRKFPINLNKKKETNTKIVAEKIPPIDKYKEDFEKLLYYTSKNYNLDYKIFVIKPVASNKLAPMMRKYGFNVIQLDNNDEEWTFGYDSHWTCYGHEEASKQVTLRLKTLNL